MGYDPEGIERLIKHIDNPSYFAEHDFDEVVSEIEGKDIDDLSNNWLTEDLSKQQKKTIWM